jgi:predicted nucleotide-binding protein (sugar kinase/HSP70/actin superfamily)
MAKLFTNQKEVDRAIQAAVDQYERYKQSLQKMGKRKKRRSKKKLV